MYKRQVQHNVLAMSGRAVEAAGDVNTLLLDKTGTITLGNREATEFVTAPGVTEAMLADSAQLSSLAVSYTHLDVYKRQALCAAAHSAVDVVAMESAKACGSASGARLQHRGLVHDEYELAELRARDHHELSDADGGSGVSQLGFGGGGDGIGHCIHPWYCLLYTSRCV